MAGSRLSGGVVECLSRSPVRLPGARCDSNKEHIPRNTIRRICAISLIVRISQRNVQCAFLENALSVGWNDPVCWCDSGAAFFAGTRGQIPVDGVGPFLLWHAFAAHTCDFTPSLDTDARKSAQSADWPLGHLHTSGFIWLYWPVHLAPCRQ